MANSLFEFINGRKTLRYFIYLMADYFLSATFLPDSFPQTFIRTLSALTLVNENQNPSEYTEDVLPDYTDAPSECRY